MVVSESVIAKSLSLGVIAILNDYVKTFKDDEDLIQMVLLIVEILADCGKSHSWNNGCRLSGHRLCPVGSVSLKCLSSSRKWDQYPLPQ